MKFERLRLAGFKSFCDPTDFKIEPGLTGVVGPNGCGKSNLVEALRWVMGESSYKNMRASGMDDVIFSGTGKRPSRNIAEVGLVLDNSDRRAPAAFNDAETIEVTRRIERESGSTYRVNGREVRARDVQLLFADASTGARSPAMVRQGQIGEIIAAKPQARRLILEEAAGVSGLHSRRHEAELRLKGAEDNLAAAGGRAQADRRADRQPETAGAAVDALSQSGAGHPPPRGAGAADRLARTRGAVRRAPSTRLEADVRAVAERTRAQARRRGCKRSPRPTLPPLRDEEARARRRAASPRARARRARGRGKARQGARRRTRAPHRAARSGSAARRGADRRRRACHGEADGRGRDARRRRPQVGRRQARGRRAARAPRTAARRRRSRSGRGAGRLRRPQRAAQRARRGARRGGAPSRPLRERMRGGRARARRVAGSPAPTTRRSRAESEALETLGEALGRGRRRKRWPPKRRTSRRARPRRVRADRSPKPSAPRSGSTPKCAR